MRAGFAAIAFEMPWLALHFRLRALLSCALADEKQK